MGYGVPAGLGLQAATGQRPVVLVGDGAFQMTGWELGNAARWAATPSCWSSTTPAGRCCAPSRPRAASTTWTAGTSPMAAGMGGDGWQRRGRFQLLDIRLAPGVLSPTLARFVKALKQRSMPD
jgi:indolepyruvate decarboxylase